VPALSNYHKIAPKALFDEPLIYIPTYEHGLNIQKVHCLCIGASDVSFLDYPWHVSLSLTQHVIHSLRQHCELVALAHPGARMAHSPEDMSELDGMQLIELVNTKDMDVPFWDGALSCGRACWILSDDDIHSLNDEKIFRHWNMVYAPAPTASSVIQAMKYGHHYGIISYDGLCEDNRLNTFQISGDTLHVALRDSFNRMDFIGQGGAALHTVTHSASGKYTLQDNDTYVRVEVHNTHCVMYLNPIFRHSEETLPFERKEQPQVQMLKTWGIRIAIVVMIGLVIFAWSRRMKNVNKEIV
jgi:hypothetical protein